MPKIMLNKLTINDLFAVNTIEQQNLFPWTENMLRNSFIAGDEIWGIKILDKMIGYAAMRLVCDEAEILNIVIDENFRSQGYGKQLMQQMLNLAKEAGVKFIFLEVRVSNYRAIAIYEQLGFTQVGIRKNYYQMKNNNHEDAYIYKLYIDATRGISFY